MKRFLQDYLRDPRMGDDKTTKYFAVFADLKDDGTKEAIVYVTGQTWCGTGGCTTLILVPKDSSYRVVTRVLITQLPIRVLASKSHGWHDIEMQVRAGQGVPHGYEAKLSFNGKSYPISPVDGEKVTSKLAGKVVVPATAEGTPLY
ncbi:MAG TPA: hypothetical protein VGR97_02470 [Candidatus Acidoferrales bacterium]|nr:hypothetical protein [Candidatus Acidoferrales bacterium]